MTTLDPSAARLLEENAALRTAIGEHADEILSLLDDQVTALAVRQFKDDNRDNWPTRARRDER